MSANVFMSLSTERGNVFHNKYLHTSEQIYRLFFFRGKNGNMKEEGIFSGAVEALLLRNIFIPFLFFENGLSISWKDLG